MSKLFISYRRDDTADICGRIYDQLAPRFGQENVFKDVDSIPLGADFRAILADAVGQCAAMLVVIGRQWVDARDAQGQRRLDLPNDFVRIEVEAALGRSIPVIPVLVQGATMPHEQELPPSLAALAYRHAFEVRGDPHFHRDIAQFIERLALLLQPAQQPARQSEPVQSAVPPVYAGLAAAPAGAGAPAGATSTPSVGPGHSRLVVQSDNAAFDLSGKAEVIIGREDPVSNIYPDVDLTLHNGEKEGVARMHAKLFLNNGQYLIEDLNSTNYTFVNRQKLQPKVPTPIKDGDEIRLGRLVLKFYAL